MNDMQVAVDRLNEAIARKERIMVYGDYDVDGVTSVALVYKFISHHYSQIDYYIPDRYDEGYGVSRKGVELAAEMGVRLIIVLDCGIKATEEIAYAKELGIDTKDSVVRTTIGLGPEGDSFALTADIKVFIPGVELDRAQALVDRAHQLCPYSKATRGNVPVTVTAVAAL